MSFATPLLLGLLLLVPLAVVLYVAWDRRRRTAGAAFASAPVMAAVAPRRVGWRRHVGPALLLLAFTGLLLAAARPQAEANVKIEQASVMLVTDRSGSMLADDVAGGRMAAVKRAAGRFLNQVPADVRTGLIAFNHQVELLQSPTTDRVAVQEQLDRLQPGGSTAAGDALARALRVLRPANQTGRPTPGAIVLLSDGKSVRGQDPIPVAQAARQAGVPIYTIALGTDQGELRSQNDDGSVRVQQVPPDRATLQRIAQISGGEYFDAPTAADLDRVYEQLGSQVATRKEQREVTAAFAGGSLALLVLGAAASLALVGRLP